MANPLLSGVNIKVQPRSGFDKSRKNILTTKVGTLTPILSEMVIPNSDVNVRLAINASLPPLASETFMRCSLKVEAFFCPFRLVYGGFESWLTGYEIYSTGSSSTTQSAGRAALPRVVVDSNTTASLYAPGSLADYLGCHMSDFLTTDNTRTAALNIFPFLCYHKIYEDWYRNTKIQKPIFTPPTGAASSTVFNTQWYRLRTLPYLGHTTIQDMSLDAPFLDMVKLGELRQRNYGVDYFTSATPSAQVGSPMTVGTTGNSFSIAALRSANSIQQWEEVQNLTGNRIQDYCKANYGARLGNFSQRVVYLGSADYPVYSKGIYATADPGQATVAQGTNPFDTVGSKYGSASASGSDFVFKGHFDEPGLVMILASLVPEVNYSTGVSAFMQRFTASGSLVDLPNPMLQNVGNEPIATSELDTYSGVRPADPSVAGTVFGYVPRYTWFKTSVNEVHGLLIDGQSLESFVAQRGFGVGTPNISTNFLEIPTTALDQVTVATAALSTYGCWIDSFIQFHVSMPLAQYSVPSLQNPAYEHGVDVHLQNNGSKIN